MINLPLYRLKALNKYYNVNILQPFIHHVGQASVSTPTGWVVLEFCQDNNLSQLIFIFIFLWFMTK